MNPYQVTEPFMSKVLQFGWIGNEQGSLEAIAWNKIQYLGLFLSVCLEPDHHTTLLYNETIMIVLAFIWTDAHGLMDKHHQCEQIRLLTRDGKMYKRASNAFVNFS